MICKGRLALFFWKHLHFFLETIICFAHFSLCWQAFSTKLVKTGCAHLCSSIVRIYFSFGNDSMNLRIQICSKYCWNLISHKDTQSIAFLVSHTQPRTLCHIFCVRFDSTIIFIRNYRAIALGVNYSPDCRPHSDIPQITPSTTWFRELLTQRLMIN